MSYNHQTIEKKYQYEWSKNKTFAFTYLPDKNTKYILEMFPYPSGNIHMGHVRNYALGDVIARFKRAQNFNVLHPMGWDSFGLPAENAAKEHNTSPNIWTDNNICEMKKQLLSLGLSIDWNREFKTSDPAYYVFEQKFFIDFFNKKLAYKKNSLVNWDPVEKTVLANEQVIDGRGWRSGAKIKKKKLNQWFFKITDYTQQLLEDIELLKDFPPSVKLMQKNWLGKKQGLTLQLKIKDAQDILTIFSTKAETIFAATFCAISPQNKLLDSWTQDDKKLSHAVDELISNYDAKSNSKEGVFTFKYAIHPINGNLLPIYVASFVLDDVGTGAVFGSPAHDSRDFEFAKKMNLEIKSVIKSPNNPSLPFFNQKGIMINSDFLNGLSVKAAHEKIIEFFKKEKTGKLVTYFKLKDWGVSRQRYWGCPIPIINCKICGSVPVDEKDLPVTLPINVSLKDTANPLLDETWYKTTCPKCGKNAIRETDTLDTFMESSWYFMRFIDPHNKKQAFNKELAEKILPVNTYIGGIEHAILHLLYARFITKALRDCGYLDINEPFKKVFTQGMVTHEVFINNEDNYLFPKDVTLKNGKYFDKNDNLVITKPPIKMSKSKKNVVSPANYIKKYGADTVRLFLLSDTPADKNIQWSETGILGANRYLKKIFSLGEKISKLKLNETKDDASFSMLINSTIAGVTDAFEQLHINVGIAKIRKLSNYIESHTMINYQSKHAFKTIIILLNPICPHICKYIWTEILREKTAIEHVNWPQYDNDKISHKAHIIMPVQINGKIKDKIKVKKNISEEEMLEIINNIPKLAKLLVGKKIIKVIMIKNKIINVLLN